MACVATWTFSLQAVQIAADELTGGASCIDALEKGINEVEDDPSTGPYYVGRGCYPNSNGIVQLDAALMRGSDRAFGSIAALEGYPKPISVARRVMEHPSLTMVVGTGATEFAQQQGFHLEDNAALLSEGTKRAFQEYKSSNVHPQPTGHDTLSMLCVDKQGDIAAGVSTSGPPFKLPGRVGDSPLPGCGLYADGKTGAAAGMYDILPPTFYDYFHNSEIRFIVVATGDGEKIMKFCPSFKIVQLMKDGRSPQEACEAVITEMKERHECWFEVAVIALDIKGNAGAATTVKEWTDFRDQKKHSGFPYSVWKLGSPPLILVQSPQ